MKMLHCLYGSLSNYIKRELKKPNIEFLSSDRLKRVIGKNCLLLHLNFYFAHLDVPVCLIMLVIDDDTTSLEVNGILKTLQYIY